MNPKYNKLALLGIIAAILLVASISAAQITDSAYQQTVIISSGTQTNISSQTYRTSVDVGTISGIVTSADYKNWLGFYYTLSDNPPGWNYNTTNLTSVIRRTDSVWFAVNGSDNESLNYGMFSWNGTSGRWQNDTPVSIGGKEAIFNVTKTVNLTKNNVVCWTFYLNDSAAQSIKTDEWCFVVNNSLPRAVNLSYPLNNSVITNRSTHFNWTFINGAVDDDLENVSYQLLIVRDVCDDAETCFTSKINVTAIEDTNYTIAELLDTDAVYNWSVRANDSSGYGPWSETFNFTVQSVVSISLPTGFVNFNTMELGTTNDTTDDLPPPLTIQNDGNVLTNISVYANASLWQAQPLNTSYFQFKATESETGAFNLTGSITTFSNMTSYTTGIIRQLNFSDAKDLARIDLLIRVPTDEPAGTKTVRVIVDGVQH